MWHQLTLIGLYYICGCLEAIRMNCSGWARLLVCLLRVWCMGTTFEEIIVLISWFFCKCDLILQQTITTCVRMREHSLSLASVKSRLVLPFWYRLTWVVPDNGPLNGCVCVLAAIDSWAQVADMGELWRSSLCYLDLRLLTVNLEHKLCMMYELLCHFYELLCHFCAFLRFSRWQVDWDVCFVINCHLTVLSSFP